VLRSLELCSSLFQTIQCREDLRQLLRKLTVRASSPAPLVASSHLLQFDKQRISLKLFGECLSGSRACHTVRSRLRRIQLPHIAVAAVTVAAVAVTLWSSAQWPGVVLERDDGSENGSLLILSSKASFLSRE
jgi:hypothetical protein